MAKNGTRQQVSVWEAMNEPIAYPSEEFGKGVAVMAAAIIMFAWLGPAFGQARTDTDLTRTDADTYEFFVSYEPIFETYKSPAYTAVMGISQASPVVMGAQTEVYRAAAGFTVEEARESNSPAFYQAAAEILDISEPIISAKEFLQPGLTALRDAWLELMADPGYVTY